MADYLVERNGWYHYFRRVPARLRQYDGRKHIRIALKTKDPVQGRRLADIQNEAVEKFWAELIRNPGSRPQHAAYQDAISTARAYGFAYKSALEVSESPLREILDRLEIVSRLDEQKIPAILGGVDKPLLMLSEAYEVYEKITAHQLVGRSDDFIRKWRNPRKRAVEHFRLALGSDKPVGDICREDTLTFRRWLADRVADEEIMPATANKDLIHLKDVLMELVTDMGGDAVMTVRPIFAGLNFKNEVRSREPFTPAFVQGSILKPGALAGLNDEARALIYIMADTGCRVSEVIGLLPEDIFLDADIPYIWVRPNDKRTLKTAQSKRQIPLVGAALAGARMVPAGFPRYDIADSVSGLVNQYFEKNGLKPSPNHTLYSLRHAFKDRLRDAGAPEEVIDNLMGHKARGPKYGRGHVLETKVKWLNEIAFKLEI